MRMKTVCIGLMLIVLLAACGKSPLPLTPIGNIVHYPRDYVRKRVVVQGRVGEACSFLLVKYFYLKDDSGEIVVVSDKAMPKKGTVVEVEGLIEEVSLGDQQLIGMVEGKEGEWSLLTSIHALIYSIINGVIAVIRSFI